MKNYLFLLMSLILTASTISANSPLSLDRFIFERVSYDEGENWEPALCQHVKLGKRGINCEASIPDSHHLNDNANSKTYRFELHARHKFNFTKFTESGDSINEVLEFSGNVIKYNGQIVALMEEGINSVSLYTPEIKAFIVMHAAEVSEENHPLNAINEIAVRNSQITSPALSIKAFPNPLVGNTLNLKSNIQVTKTVIYDTAGRPLITDHEVWNTQRSISLDGLPPGNYLIECHSGEQGKSSTAMIKILKQ